MQFLGINTETDDKRIVVFWRSVDTPTKVKEVELTIDSDFDQRDRLSFMGLGIRMEHMQLGMRQII